MPRVITNETYGCPPIRALTFDSLGLIKGSHFPLSPSLFLKPETSLTELFFFFQFDCAVTEARGKERGTPTVVNTWGEANASRCVLASSMDDRLTNPVIKFHPFLKNVMIEEAKGLF